MWIREMDLRTAGLSVSFELDVSFVQTNKSRMYLPCMFYLRLRIIGQLTEIIAKNFSPATCVFFSPDIQ